MVTSDDIRLLNPGAEGYPAGLMDLERPPPIFLRGGLVDRPHIAVVGTRRCTGYGTRIAAEFGRYFGQAGWVTVSGLARGIDAAAHRGTLEVQGSGLAVLGCGINTVYPKSNSDLLRGLLDAGGAVVSEYPDSTPPERWRFPARNRLIAAMSAAVVVVESAVTGGALITATLAAEIGRPVFSVPGDIDRPASVGTNLLIRDGAVPVLGPADLVQALALELGLDAPAAGTATTTL
jgi:DNA processing protein